MKRREFLHTFFTASAVCVLAKSLKAASAFAATAAKKITAKDILKPGDPATIANYCEKPEKKPNKFCPSWTEGHCVTCQFFNKDSSLTTFQGKSYARCQLLTDPSKPQFVNEKEGYCATYVKKS